MSVLSSKSGKRLAGFASGTTHTRALVACAWALAVFVLFYDLGAPGLFEPDEGRNSEKARELLLLGDWITPHENFVPVLDKPVFFYWLIAASFRVFGLSEWAARLPSALAALGCLVLVYRFARQAWGPVTSAWSVLILATSLEFFILARTVIFDMTLTFFITLALFSFHRILYDRPERRWWFRALLYAALGFGTLVKGPVALALPGMVGVCFFLFTREWSRVRDLKIGLGVLIWIALVAPWYAFVEIRNEGYLQFFLWDENIRRFLLPDFDRDQPWYYFVGVLIIGFSPWVFLLPLAGRQEGRAALRPEQPLLLLWAAVPFVFFSLSTAKLPHYILPIFPALALITAKAAADFAAAPSGRAKWVLHLPWWFYLANIAYLTAGCAYPRILPVYFRHDTERLIFWVLAWAAGVLIAYVLFVRFLADANQRRPARLWTCYAVAGALSILPGVEIMVSVSDTRSARPVAAEIASLGSGARQVVFYDTYMPGMTYYLRSDRPVWIVTYPHKVRTVLSNFYAIENQPRPTTRYGAAVFTFDEFKPIWIEAKSCFLIVVKQKNLNRMNRQLGQPGIVRAHVDEYALVANQPAHGSCPEPGLNSPGDGPPAGPAA